MFAFAMSRFSYCCDHFYLMARVDSAPLWSNNLKPVLTDGAELLQERVLSAEVRLIERYLGLELRNIINGGGTDETSGSVRTR